MYPTKDPEVIEEQVAEADDSMVEIHEATREELDSALTNAVAEEEAASVEPDEQVSDDPEIPEKEVPTDNPVVAKTTTGDVAAVGAVPSKPARTYTEDEIQGLLADRERLKKEGNQKELFIQHRGNELGTVRQQLAASKQQLSEVRARLVEGLEDRFSENPVEAMNDRDKINKIDQQLAIIDQKDSRAVRIVEAQTLFLKHVDTDNISIDDIADTLRADGADERFVAELKANPWEFTTPEALVQMGRRAMDRKELKQADGDRRTLAKHVLYLNEEIKKLKSRPKQVLAQVQRNLNQVQNVTGSGGVSSRKSSSINPASIPDMGNQELAAALNQAMREEGR